MKKLLLILLSIMTVFCFASCDSCDKDNQPATSVTDPDTDDPNAGDPDTDDPDAGDPDTDDPNADDPDDPNVGDTTTYTVSVTQNNAEAGTVTGADEYEANADVTLTATTKENYTFIGWYDSEGRLLSADATYTFKATATCTIEARWVDIEDPESSGWSGIV